MKIDLEDYFELEQICKWINDNNFSNVALQFPDEMLKYSFDISTYIKDHTLCRPYILADTSYGSCCVDIIAAQHVNSDAFVHFGPACLFSETTIPIYYAFGNESLTMNSNLAASSQSLVHGFVEALRDVVNEDELLESMHTKCPYNELAKRVQILLFYDFQYWRALIGTLDQMNKELLAMIDSLLKSNSPQKSSETNNIKPVDKIILDFIISAPDFPFKSMKLEPPPKSYSQEMTYRECSRIIPLPNTPYHSYRSSVIQGNQKEVILNFITTCDMTNQAPFSTTTKSTLNHQQTEASTPEFQEISPKEQCAECSTTVPKTLLIYIGDAGSASFARIYFHYYPRRYVTDPGSNGGHFKMDAFYAYDPRRHRGTDSDGVPPIMTKEDVSISRSLARRLHYVEKGREARIFGIITGILCDRRSIHVVNRLRGMIRAAGKKSYTFTFGKLNPHKLANFGEIDAFVLLACPQTSLISSERAKEFYRPVLTPWELEASLSQPDGDPAVLAGTGGGVRIDLDYAALYHVTSEEVPNTPQGSSDALGVTTLSIADIVKPKCLATELSANSLVLKDAMEVGMYTSHDYYSKLSWKGLEIGDRNDAPAIVKEGRSGIASSYTSEPKL